MALITREYARDHLIHLLVLAALAIYPAVYHVLTNGGAPTGMVALLPRVETMVAVLYFGLFAMSFDFISGYTGYLSFGHAAFYGTGAYFVVLVANGKVPLLAPETPFIWLLVLAGVLAAVLALVIGTFSFRLTGVYFAMITLGFAQVLYVFMRDWEYLGANPRDGIAVTGLTEGFRIGVPGVDSLSVAIGQLAGEPIDLFGSTLGASTVSYYAVGLVVVVCYIAMQRIIHSPFGRVMIAIRENEARARAIGYNTFYYKLGAFSMSAFFAGVAGGLFAGFRRSVTPENGYYFLVTGDALLASIIGGFGTLAGPLYGRLFDEGLREFLSKSGSGGGLLVFLRDSLGHPAMETVVIGGMTVGELVETFLNGHAPLYVGIVFVLFVLYVPNGMVGTVRDRLGGTCAKQLPAWLSDRLTAIVTAIRERVSGVRH